MNPKPFGPVSASASCLVVIVTHNSERHIRWCLAGLDDARSRLAIRIVDSGSESSLLDFSSRHPLEIRRCRNIGFVAANNLAIDLIGDVPWVLFLNPDARIDGKALDSVILAANSVKRRGTGVLTVPLVRYDIEAHCTLGTYDTVGIVSTWYGRWHDRLSGAPVSEPPGVVGDKLAAPEAVCGAFMLVRSAALLSAPDSTGHNGFERKYFMYKEDIELSLRLRTCGWRVELLTGMFAYHCRGWRRDRCAIPQWARLQSAMNDLDIAYRYLWRAVPFALLKLLWVRFIERHWHSFRASSRGRLHGESV